MSPSRLLRPALLAAFAFAVAAPPVAAQSKSLGTGKPSGALLTRNELRHCLASQDRLKAQREQAQKQQDQLAKEKADIERLGSELKEQLATLERTSQEQVDRYNAQAAERDRLIDAWETRTTAFNTQAAAINAEAAAWKRGCENRRYDENDELLIKAGK
jgi:chromosome segregation ATPase